MVPMRLARMAAFTFVAVAAHASSADQRMDRQIRAAVARFTGTVSLYARNLDSGRSYGIRENERVRTASTIKLPVLVAAFAAVAAEGVRWEETLELKDSDKVSGSGVVRELSELSNAE